MAKTAEHIPVAQVLSACPNCEHSYRGNFCPQCGQETVKGKISFRTVMKEFFHEFFELDGRIFRTLKALMFKPGHLTQEFFANRRKKYISPVRLLIASTLLYFLFLPEIPISLFEEDSQLLNRIDWSHLDKIEEQQFSGKVLLAMKMDHFQEKMTDGLPNLIFLMIPILAVVLKLVYIRRKRSFTEHLIYSLHIHSFFFFISLISLLLSSLLDVLANSSFTSYVVLSNFGIFFIYEFFAMKRFYGQGNFKTFLKFSLIEVAYVFWAVILIMGYVIFLVLQEFDWKLDQIPTTFGGSL